MADIYTSARLFVGELIGVGEPPHDRWGKTYGWLGFRVLEQLMDDHTGDRKFMWTYLKREDNTPDGYWSQFEPGPQEIQDAVKNDGISLWWYVWSEGMDNRLWEEVKDKFLKVVNGQGG